MALRARRTEGGPRQSPGGIHPLCVVSHDIREGGEVRRGGAQLGLPRAELCAPARIRPPLEHHPQHRLIKSDVIPILAGWEPPFKETPNWLHFVYTADRTEA